MSIQAIDWDPVSTETAALYGITIKDYTYGGQACDFESLLVEISTSRATLIEGEISPVSAQVQKRNERLSKLGEALSELSRIQASFADDAGGSTQSTDTVTDKTQKIVGDLNVNNNQLFWQGKVTKASVEEAIQLVKTEIDRLNNASQSDMTRLQTLVDKRDESFSTASQLMQSVSDTRSNVIRILGS